MYMCEVRGLVALLVGRASDSRCTGHAFEFCLCTIVQWP